MSITISYPSTQFEELYGPFVNLGPHLPPKHNSPIELRGNEMGHAYGELDGPLIRWKGIIKIPLHAWFKGWEMLNAFA